MKILRLLNAMKNVDLELLKNAIGIVVLSKWRLKSISNVQNGKKFVTFYKVK